MRSNQEFLAKLARPESEHGHKRTPEENIIYKLAKLVCALDVKIKLSYEGKPTVNLNDPLLYEKDLDTIWSVLVVDAQWVSPGQKQMLAPLRSESGQLFGYCGLSVAEGSVLTLKSVGGLVTKERYAGPDYICGIADYEASSANRAPGRLAAPAEVIRAWADGQIVRALSEGLTEYERETAAKNLGKVVDDIRPIFLVRTNLGALNLHEVISALRDKKKAIFPVDTFSVHSAPPLYYHYSLPHIGFEFHFRFHDIEFSHFSICPSTSGTIVVYEDTEKNLRHNVPPNVYDDIWKTIINTLVELKIDFQIDFLENFPIGKYAGLDSLRHNLRTHDDITSKVIRISL